MSGILLPGQENEPSNEGKIELPSGYRSSKPASEKHEEKETPAESTPTEDKEQAKQQPPQRLGQQAGRQGMSDLLFPPQGAQVRCPSCGNTYVAPIFSIIDLGADPELRSPLLAGQLNVGVCQNCGTGGPLSAPLMVHDPDNKFLGVFVPFQAGDDLQQQKIIGDLQRRLLAKVPKEQQRGYMLQPQAFMDMQRMMEKLWGFEGVTPEMLHRQRDQGELLQRLMTLVNDDTALNIAIERGKNLIDREFFTMLDQILVMSRSQVQDSPEVDQLRMLRDKLVERTEAGQVVQRQAERVQEMLSKVNEDSTREDLLEIVLDVWDEEDSDRLVGTFALATGISADYEFLMLVAQRMEAAESDEERARLEELRQFLMGIQEQVNAQQQQSQEASMQHAQALLQEVLQATDTAAVLREHIEDIDEPFLALVADNIRRMEESNSAGAAHRFMRIYQQALEILREQMPPDMRLLNDLISAPDDAAARQLLRENRQLVNKDFLTNLKTFEEQMRQNGQPHAADRIKSIRGQVALML